MADKAKISVGDVFQITIDSARVGYGQVVLRPEKNVKGVLFICVYAETTRPGEIPSIRQIVQSDILLAGNTFDAKLNHRHWPIVGNITDNLPSIALPHYKCAQSDAVVVENLERTRRRQATAAEANELPLRTYTSPAVFELALKAIGGVGEWRDEFDDLKYDELRKSSEVVV